MTLATLTDKERAGMLASICAEFGLNYNYVTEDDLWGVLRKEREDAEKYRALCR